MTHTLTLNDSLQNAGDGYENSSTGSLFDRNRGDYTAGFGFVDSTVGSGTGFTANTDTGNRCTGNDLGQSCSPDSANRVSPRARYLALAGNAGPRSGRRRSPALGIPRQVEM